ncbi:hypothetical protein MTQ01_02125 [Streptomyces sp. XM4193]|uniref:hypothetical protein n=1 Tax=Streptomyces sp. XM4193 TaxID=2929782 RepID=UPI001FF8F3E8|nr:hypothetical protein [Streptomyces sp. XM4193]MCK1794838.1 hypothetical protein [Streptomyces sp. XM4193]
MISRTDCVERALADARLRLQPYSPTETDTAELRVAARVADRILNGTLDFEELMAHDRDRDGTPHAPDERSADAQLRDISAALAGGGGTQAAEGLRTLCRVVVGRDGAPHELQCFLAQRLLEPDGARVLGCVLHLAGRDSAQFWWQFAAGAGDWIATYCLRLHHLSMGETVEARFWARQTASTDLLREAVNDCDGTLRVLSALCRDHPTTTALVKALLDYVPDAVTFEEEFDLPLPHADFAAHIEQLEENLPARVA